MKRKTHKVKILIPGMGGAGWIGGLYYRKNIIYSLLSNETISNNTSITLITEKQNAHIFEIFSDKIDIKYISYRNNKERELKYLLYSLFVGADVVFPHYSKREKLLPGFSIHWIPDFQHNRLPEFFGKEELNSRTAQFQEIATGKAPLILSSYDSLVDFRKYYSANKKNVYVVPFVSYIEPELKQMTADIEVQILKKYNLDTKKYIAVMNQFWQHKNHMIVFKAMQKYFENNADQEIIFVFTGAVEDYRNPEYTQSLKEIMKKPNIKGHMMLLGFIDRMEQLTIMKNAEYIIQPSLFEGWGTVVEDAKVLDKTILLSDIPVHREQKNDKCILFDPYDENMLVDMIEMENKKQHTDDIASGIVDMKCRAKTYSKGFEKLLLEMGALKE